MGLFESVAIYSRKNGNSNKWDFGAEFLNTKTQNGIPFVRERTVPAYNYNQVNGSCKEPFELKTNTNLFLFVYF